MESRQMDWRLRYRHCAAPERSPGILAHQQLFFLALNERGWHSPQGKAVDLSDQYHFAGISSLFVWLDSSQKSRTSDRPFQKNVHIKTKQENRRKR
jgi:hypothetical protein